MGGGGDSPTPPDYARTFQSGVDVWLRNLPTLLAAEAQNRATTDPERIQQQQDLQQQFGPTQYQQQLDALHQLDPESAQLRPALAAELYRRLQAGEIDPQSGSIRTALGERVLSDLNAGYTLPADYAREIETNVRGAQARRGNILGNAPALVESSVKGKAAADLYQQHLQNAFAFGASPNPNQQITSDIGNFLSTNTPEQQLLAVQPVSADRTFAYANPGAGTAGANFGLQNYQNLLAGQQLQNQSNPWLNAASGAASGAATGTAIAPGWGTLIGGVVGAGLGYASDIRLKEDIREIGRTKSGIPLISFRYLGGSRRFIGARGQDVQKIRPDAVRQDERGFLRVLYDKLDDVPFFELGVT